MKLTTKILLLITISIFLVMGAGALLSVNQTQRIVYEQIDHLLTNNLEFAENKILETTLSIKRTTEIIARHPAISKSLFLQVSRGINRVLNETIIIYPFYNYILIAEPDGTVFASSTKDFQGNKIAGEQLLGRSIQDNALYRVPSPQETTIGSPGIDPFFNLLKGDNPSPEKKISQWFITPVQKRGQLIGWVVLSYNWQDELSKVLSQIQQQLIAVEDPVLEVILTDQQENILVGRSSNHSKFIASENKLWKIKGITFGKKVLNIIISNDRYQMNAPVRENRNFMFMVMISITLILGILLYFILNRSLASLKTLTHLSRDIAQSPILTETNRTEFFRLIKSNDEVGILSESLNMMMIELQKSYHSLEQEKQKQLQHAYESGIAENAISVLHNIGNAITPAVVNLKKLQTAQEKSRLLNYLDKLSENLKKQYQAGNLDSYLRDDPKGQQMLPFLETLLKEMEMNKAQENERLQVIENQLKHVSEIIRLQQKYANFKAIEEDFELSMIIKDSLSMMKSAFKRRNIKIIQTMKTDQTFTIDKNKLIQVIVNFLKNAVESIDDRLKNEPGMIPEIHLEMDTQEKQWLQVQIKDSGNGIAPETLDHVFKFGFSTKERGSGFGLHDCANFIRALGGHIQLTSPGIGQGATVLFTLPIAQSNGQHKQSHFSTTM